MIRVRAKRRAGGTETAETLEFEDEAALLAAQDEAVAEWSRAQGLPDQAAAYGPNPCVSRRVTRRSLKEGRAGLRLVSRSPGPDADLETWEVLLPPGARRRGGRRRRR